MKMISESEFSRRLKIVREVCLRWSIQDTSSQTGASIEEIREYESNGEYCSCSYLMSLCDNAGVCPDLFINLPSKEQIDENPEARLGGLMEYSFEHYLFKLKYKEIDKDGYFENFKEPDYMEILSLKDFRNKQ